jgi:hypothetical protein
MKKIFEKYNNEIIKKKKKNFLIYLNFNYKNYIENI